MSLEFFLIAVIILLASFVQGFSGFGFALVSIPLLSLVINIKEAVPLGALCGLVVNVYLIFHLKEHIEIKEIKNIFSRGLRKGVLFPYQADKAKVYQKRGPYADYWWTAFGLQEEPSYDEALVIVLDGYEREQGKKIDWLEKEITNTAVRGLIVHRQLWCDLWHAEVPRIKQNTGLPVLDLETGSTSSGSEERQRTRIQAFLETLQ